MKSQIEAMNDAFATVRTVEEVFGEPLPPLTEEQCRDLNTMLRIQIDTLFRGEYQRFKGDRNRLMARRLLLDRITLKQAGAEFGITPGRAGQLRLKALRLLRHPTRSHSLRAIFEPRDESIKYGVPCQHLCYSCHTPWTHTPRPPCVLAEEALCDRCLRRKYGESEKSG